MRNKHVAFVALVLAALMGVAVPPSRPDVSFEGFFSDLGPHGSWLVSWGAIPYHYGTWTLDPSLGWVWIPGYTWAPAWVEFRTGPDYVGWAPVAPGFSFGLSFGGYAAPSAPFLFVPTRNFAAPRIRSHVVRKPVAERIVHETRPAGNLVLQHDIVINRGPDVRVIEAALEIAPSLRGSSHEQNHGPAVPKKPSGDRGRPNDERRTS